MKSYGEIKSFLESKDEVLKSVIAATSVDVKPSLEIDIYRELLSSIVSQQLSVKVADVIWGRFIELFGDGYPHATTILSLEDEVLRSAGLSRQKLSYIKNVAQFSLENDMSFEYLNAMSDEEIIKYLTAIKGIGKWTVQMVLMFPMDRPDIFPVDDLGIQVKMKYWYKLDLEKKALKDELIKISEKWKPYRSLGAKYLWKSEMG